MVDLVGFEPTTSSMPWKRAPNCATGPLTATLASVILRCSGREVKPGMPPEERARIFGQIKSFFSAGAACLPHRAADGDAVG